MTFHYWLQTLTLCIGCTGGPSTFRLKYRWLLLLGLLNSLNICCDQNQCLHLLLNILAWPNCFLKHHIPVNVPKVFCIWCSFWVISFHKKVQGVYLFITDLHDKHINNLRYLTTALSMGSIFEALRIGRILTDWFVNIMKGQFKQWWTTIPPI